MFLFNHNGFDVYKYPLFYWAHNGTKTVITNDYDKLFELI